MGRNVWSNARGSSLNEGLTTFEDELYRDHVAEETHNHYNNKTTVLVIKLKSGFEIVGVSNCEDPEKFSEELGRTYALKRALEKLAEFQAYCRAEIKHTFRDATTVGKVTAVDEGFTEAQRKQLHGVIISALRDFNLGIFR